jgi:hypothetical protein
VNGSDIGDVRQPESAAGAILREARETIGKGRGSCGGRKKITRRERGA